ELEGSGACGFRQKNGRALRASGDLSSLYPPVIIDRSEYGSTANTMITCASDSPTSTAIVRKCQYRAHTYPPNKLVSHESCTGFQIAIPVTTAISPKIGNAK